MPTVYVNSNVGLCRVRVEHARGTPRGSDMRRDEERGILYRNNRERRSPERFVNYQLCRN